MLLKISNSTKATAYQVFRHPQRYSSIATLLSMLQKKITAAALLTPTSLLRLKLNVLKSEFYQFRRALSHQWYRIC